MYVNRFNGYLYQESLNYNELYFPKESYRIQTLASLPKDSFVIGIQPSADNLNWFIKDSKGGNYEIKSKQFPKLKLLNGVNSYSINSPSQKYFREVVLEIEHNSVDNGTAINTSSIPMIPYELYPIEKWIKFSDNISQQEIDECKKIIKQNNLINDTNTTLEKIENIGVFLCQKLKPQEGAPSAEIKLMAPLKQYQLVCAKKDKIDCAVYADIFHFFANCANIPTRKIGVSGTIDYVSIAGHVFDEAYISEQQKWAFVDLTSNKLYVKNKKQEVLNTINLLNIKNSNTQEGNTAIIVNQNLKKDSTDYSKINQAEKQFFKETVSFYVIKENINDHMNFKENFKEYLGTTSHWGLCYDSTLKIDNSKHYLKLFVLKTSAILFFIWCFVIVIKLIFRNKSIKTQLR